VISSHQNRLKSQSVHGVSNTDSSSESSIEDDKRNRDMDDIESSNISEDSSYFTNELSQSEGSKHQHSRKGSNMNNAYKPPL
jgi:hypothetical protein